MARSQVVALAVLIVVAGLIGCPAPPGDGPDVVPPAPPVDETAQVRTASAPRWGVLYGTETEILWVAEEPVSLLSRSNCSYDARAEISPDGRKLAVFTDDLSVEVIDLSTGEVSALAGPLEGERWREYLVWSPDGGRLAWTEDGNVFVSEMDGEPSQIVSTGDVTDLAWAPDGSKLALCRRDRAEWGLGMFVVPADGGEMTQVAPASNDIVAASNPAWSPDGSVIAFCRSWEVGTLCFAYADGSPARLEIGPAMGRPIWLGDGSGVVYSAQINEMETLGVYFCAPERAPQAVFDGEFADFDMSPDGRLLVVESTGNGESGVSIIEGLPGDMEVAARQRVPVDQVRCSWRPDGRAFAVWGTVGAEPTAQVFVGDGEGGRMTRLEIDAWTVIGWGQRHAQES